MRLKKLGTFGAGSLLLTASTLLAINEPTSVPVPDTTPQLPPTKGDAASSAKSTLQRQFLLANPGMRISQWDKSRRIYGVSFGKAASPVAAAEQFRRQHAGMLGLNADNLVPANSQWRGGGHVQPVMFDAAIGAYKFTAVYYEQNVDGVAVHGSRMTVLVRNDSNEIVLVNPDTRELDGFRPDARLARNAQTAPAARGKIRGRFGNLAIMQPERKVVWAGDSPNAKVTPRLADESLVVVGPAKYRVVTDAVTGEVLHTEDLICFGGITGNVSGLVTDGLGSEQCEPEVSKALPYLEVTAGSNSTFTDINGDFALPGGALSTGASLTGQWFEVFNFAGGVTSESTTSTPADLFFNSANTDPLIRAQVNAYFESNRVRDFALSFNPAYPGLQFSQFPVTVNRTDGFCPGNAWFDPADNGGNGSINFCQEGGGSPNTSWSSVVMHEYGHNLVNKAGSGQGQYGEGMSDCIQTIILDTQYLGIGFFGSCDPADALRDPVANFRTYPCSGTSHDCGQLISGCVWGLIEEMKIIDPVNALDIVGNLTVNSILVHSGSGIDPSITTDFLVLDDDNGNLGDGTPHELQINTAFGAHNMAAVAPPTNDDCSDAIEICPGEPQAGTLLGTSNDGSSSCGDTAGASDAWFVYSPMTNGTLSASLCGGTDYDSVISVHTGCPGTTGNQIACDDDGCGSTGGPSSLSVGVTGGEAYFIRITGWQGAIGNYTLSVSGPDCQPLIPPSLVITLPNGVPNAVAPDTSTTMAVQIEAADEGYASGSATMFYRYDGGAFQSVALAELGGDQFEATLPAADCADTPEFYITANGDLGTPASLPFDAPLSFLDTVVGVKVAAMDDDFEGDLGWAASNNGASSGNWQRGTPVDDPNWANDPATDGDGSGQAYLTENQNGNTDVDGGSVTLTSPMIDMSGSGVYTVRYLYYLLLTNADGTDRLFVEASSNGDAGPWLPVATHDTDGGVLWRENVLTETDLGNAGVSLTSTMKFRFTANDGDPQSIVEAGVDGVLVESFECLDPVSSACSADCAPENGDGSFGNNVVNIDDLLSVINEFGALGGPCDNAPDNGDGTFGNGVVNIDDVLGVINAFGPCPE